jgi:hypothetical protein
LGVPTKEADEEYVTAVKHNGTVGSDIYICIIQNKDINLILFL